MAYVIQHYGISGMKWGVRKKREQVSKPTRRERKVLKDQQKAQAARRRKVIAMVAVSATLTAPLWAPYVQTGAAVVAGSPYTKAAIKGVSVAAKATGRTAVTAAKTVYPIAKTAAITGRNLVANTGRLTATAAGKGLRAYTRSIARSSNDIRKQVGANARAMYRRATR